SVTSPIWVILVSGSGSVRMCMRGLYRTNVLCVNLYLVRIVGIGCIHFDCDYNRQNMGIIQVFHAGTTVAGLGTTLAGIGGRGETTEYRHSSISSPTRARLRCL